VKALELDPKTYARHSLHAADRVWVEKNCYIDVWIEVVHALGLDPMAMMAFTVALDFEGDQWTFWKPSHSEIWELYGIDVQELNVWRPLLEHAQEHLGAGKMISTEADAWWLPDTAGTDYRRSHTKTTIVMNELDVAAKRLGYFHNASYHALEGEDFDKTFEPMLMPLFAEVLRFDRVVRRDDLRARAREHLRRAMARRPVANPVPKFAARFAQDLPGIQAKGIEHYHQWAFATIRQLGGAFETAALFVRWLEDAALAPAADAFDAISNGCKTFIMKGARAAASKKPFDGAAMFDELASAWQRGLDHLEKAL
jgi:hypothetical protein